MASSDTTSHDHWQSHTTEAVGQTPQSSLRIGVLSLHNSKETKAILNAIQALGHEPVWLCEENLRLHIEADEPTIQPNVDVVVNRLLLSSADTPLDDLELATTLASQYPLLNEPQAVLTAIHKYATAMTLANAGIPTPDSALALDPAGANAETDHLTTTTINKPAIGTHGDNAWKEDETETHHPLRLDSHTIHQSFLKQDAAQSDVRVYVVDGEIIAAMQRTATDDDWRANVARGGTPTDAASILSTHAHDIAIRATEAIGLDIAGVDLMQHEGEWYVLEVNPTAGFRGLFEATGTSPAPVIAQAAIERGGGTVDSEQVADLSSTLDDSVPACKPDNPSSDREPQTIGATELVTLEGSNGSTRVVAKIDTGADRTSIDVEVAAAIGAGPITEYTSVRSATGDQSTTRPVVDVHLAIAGRWEAVEASIEDRSHMNYPVILGKDVLSGYQIDIDKRADDAKYADQPGRVAYADEE